MLQDNRKILSVIGEKLWVSLKRACGGRNEAENILREFEIRSALDPEIGVAVDFAANRDKRIRGFAEFVIKKIQE